ncbi:hypothetical protein H6P81_005800 [Aristolochia fimbriata]|uniref:Uncharacterized protein n=1 Tax=Aristolochia fimbriata TaxID=158543 RepID=A0AAV7EZ79_ARIFI|nr:hypothetical protein H6P81_005800 [Aristolochia fimbriata]
MEMELEPRVKPLPYKIKAMSRESPSQKALHVLDSDLRTHWSTGTNTKEWILLELEEPCLLSHIRIYNKSVLEWEIAVGLRYKPETFVKVRPRCEAPRRDMIYPVNYTPCRYVRISCLRGNPIAIFFIQLIGVSVVGLEPEFQPIVSHLLPNIISNKQDVHDMHLQLLQDMTIRLLPFLSHLEADLANFSEAAESSLRYFAMLVGPFYPILSLLNEREHAKAFGGPDVDALRHNQPSTLTVSSNFEAQPRRLRSPSPFAPPGATSVAFRPDSVFMLLRKAYKDPRLGAVCRLAARALHKLSEPGTLIEALLPSGDTISSSVLSEVSKVEEAVSPRQIADYSCLFGEEFKLPDDHWDVSYLNVLDIGLVEEGILHVLFACASQPLLCSKLVDNNTIFWSALPLVQALLPALRPPMTSLSDHLDDSFTMWRHPSVQQALFQIVGMASSSVYLPLLHACAGYLSSFLPSHAKAACILIDLCTGPLAPWIPMVIAKVDLTIELLEDLLGTIQGVRHFASQARAALKYIILALSGHMDDILAKYKEVKHKLLFLIEMLEPFLDPAITSVRNTIAFGDVSATFMEKREQSCALALSIIRVAVCRPAVLPSLESEWRRGSVPPSVLLSILGPHISLPPEIDQCKCSTYKTGDHESSTNSSGSSVLLSSINKSDSHEESDGKCDALEMSMKMDVPEDSNILFAPPELKNMMLRSPINHFEGLSSDKITSQSSQNVVVSEKKHTVKKNMDDQNQNTIILDLGFASEYFHLQADYFHLVNHQDSDLRASEFRRLAIDLHSQSEVTVEAHDAAIDSLLLAAECYVNPFFMMTFRTINPELISRLNFGHSKIIPERYGNITDLKGIGGGNSDLEKAAQLELKRDRVVLEILLQAAEMDKEYHQSIKSDQRSYSYDNIEVSQGVKVLPPDEPYVDAVTLIRHNQALLCQFLMQRLQRDQHSMHEILMQCLLFLLHCATELFCPPEEIIDVMLGSAEHLNRLLTSLFYQMKEGSLLLDPEKVYGVQRIWVLLQRLVIASGGGDDGAYFAINTPYKSRYRSLVPPSSWIQMIPKFSVSAFPLVRFLGWMAVSEYAKQYVEERIFLASDLSQLTSLLAIFTDELALVDDIVNPKNEGFKSASGKESYQVTTITTFSDKIHDDEGSFHVIYPDLHKFCPNMKRQFGNFGEVILEAVTLQLKSLPVDAVPDALCWFSQLCSWPYLDRDKDQQATERVGPKGFAIKNAKAIILYVLEAIVAEYMEAMLPEIPRVVQILLALCKNSYFDVDFLNSLMSLLKPLISYALQKASTYEKLLSNDSSCLSFETLCFEELLNGIRNDSQEAPTEREYQRALVIFILGTVYPDLSFLKRIEVLHSVSFWADFASEPASSFYDYLLAFLKLVESCQEMLIHALGVFGINPIQSPQVAESNSSLHGGSFIPSQLLGNQQVSQRTEAPEELGNTNSGSCPSDGTGHYLSLKEIEEFCEVLETLISKLIPTVDGCWKLHPQLAKKVTLTMATSCLYSGCLASICRSVKSNEHDDCKHILLSNSGDQFSSHWRSALTGVSEAIVKYERNHCWQVASFMLDFILGLPQFFCLEHVVPSVCSSIKHFCSHAPKISWRLQTDKWITMLFARDIGNLQDGQTFLGDLFCTMLGHSEPEQRSIAILQLGRLVGQSINETARISYFTLDKSSVSHSVIAIPEAVLCFLVTTTWDMVAAIASLDTCMILRTHSMVLLLDYIPFAQRSQLQSFLGAADKILHALAKPAYPIRGGHMTQLSLALIGNACLYSPAEDIALLPETVWRNLESLGRTKAEGRCGEIEKACQALCRLRIEGDAAKEVLKEALSSSATTKHSDPEFGSTRETVLQVLSNLSSVKLFFDLFSKKMDQEDRELEEAEIELDLIQAEQALQDVSQNPRHEVHQSPSSLIFSTHQKDKRLEQIKDVIHSLEKAKLREEIAARRQKKLFERCARQKFLEEAALRETELLKELDRERTSLADQEIERQRLLELERAKTRELRYNLDMERERQTQRELQRELEQAESGVRPSRREFSSSTSGGRPRERYRERENGRSSHDGGPRSSSRGRENTSQQSASSGLPAATNMSSTPTVVLSSRAFPNQPPTILQSRDRVEDRSVVYEENLDGSRDSGDTGSVGDPDLASAFDGSAGGFGSSGRQGARGNKSRQIMERRERDGRREGKWERKHS